MVGLDVGAMIRGTYLIAGRFGSGNIRVIRQRIPMKIRI
jgi:hypothetical protein